MPRAGITHDITIRSYDRTIHRGFMLTRDRNGTRAFRRRDAQTIRPRILSMGELTHAELPPELELTWFQEDWSLGIGGVTDRLDPKKLSMTNKMDSSVQGVLRPAREATLTAIQSGETPNNYRPSGFAVVPMTTAASAINYDLWMFLGRDVYKWAVSSEDWSRETEPLAADVYYKNAVIFGTYAVAPGGYAGSDLTDCAAPYIYKNAADANWTSSTITAGRFRYMAVGRNSSGDEILWGGNHIFKTARTVDEALDASETDVTLDANASGHVAVNDIIVVDALGDQETMLVTGVSSAVLTVVRGYGCTAVEHDSGAIVSLYQPHVIKSSADASNTGSWSTAVTIGTDDAPITGLVFDRDTDTLLITKTDGLYSYASDGQVRNLATLFRQFGHSQNFVGAYPWNGHVLLPVGAGGLLDFDYASGTIKDISLSVLAPEQSDLHGKIVAMHGDPTSLFVLLKAATTNHYYVLQGQEVAHEGVSEFRWHILAKLGAAGTLYENRTALLVDTSRSGRRRLWIGYEENSVSSMPYFIAFGTVGDDDDDGFTNDTDAYATTTQWDANLPRVDKRYEEVEVQTRNLGAGGRTVKVEYQLNGDGNWNTLDTIALSPFATVKFPEGTTGKLIELRFTPALTSVGTTAAEILSFRVKAQLRPDPAKIYEVTIYIADEMQLLNGAIASTARNDLAQVRDWNEAATELILHVPAALQRSRRAEHEVVFLPGTLQEREVGLENGRHPEMALSFQLAEV
jgi:hypothetical protein